MKKLNNNYQVEVKDKTYVIQPNEDKTLKEHKEQQSLGIQCQYINETQVKSQKVNKSEDEE